MLARDSRRRGPEQRQLLEMQLPQRLARLCRRGEQLLAEGWDINVLHLLAEDAALLADACRLAGAPAQAASLDALQACTAALLQPPRLPDAAARARIAELIAAIQAQPSPSRGHADVGAVVVAGPTHEFGFPLRVVPPRDYWNRLAAARPHPAAYHDTLRHAAAGGPDHQASPPTVSDWDAPATPAPNARDLVERIRFALDASGFELLFQPIMSLRGEEHEQFQALLRLRGDDQRLHAAAEVVPAAERAGLIGAVDRWVLEHCTGVIGGRPQRERWPRLFVSQSMASVRDVDLPHWLRALLERDDVPAAALSLELDADEATTAFAEVERYAHAMKALGAGITLSAFAAGARTERLLRALPVDFVKLAPRYRQVGDAAISAELGALVERLHASGQRVIAPRVEDARGAAALWNTGVDFIQGNFVQRADHAFAFDFGAAVM